MPQTQAKKKKSETKPKPLNIAFVWDMSGSMATIDDVTREGTRGYLMDLVKEEKKLIKAHGDETYTRFSLTVFDTVFENWIDNEPVLDIPIDRIINDYQPRGGTALFDAIANTITQLDTSAAGRKGEKFLVVVMSDGQENSSQEYGPPNGRSRLNKLIKKYEQRGNWTFVYLGANVDAYAEATSMGISRGNTIAYSASAASAKMTSPVITDMTGTLRGSPAGSMNVNLVQDSGNVSDLRDEDDK